MSETTIANLKKPRFEIRRGMLIAGFQGHYDTNTVNDIPLQWQRFGPDFGKVPGQLDHSGYGVVFNMNSGKGFDYVSGVAVSSRTAVPEKFVVVSIPERKYAIFCHREHVSKLKDTVTAIWQQWLPSSGYAVPSTTGTPDIIEWYGPNFDPHTGMGDMEVWVPIKT
jgi:AraC family transcriptional regulator